jgi:hypothetical protein
MTTKVPAAETVSLKALCAELKVDPYDARQRLRAAVKDKATYPALAKAHQPRKAWEWEKASPALKEARKALTAE